MFQIKRADIVYENGQQTALRVLFESGEEILINFSDIPADRDTAAEKAAWLKEQLNERLIVGHKPDGTPIRHYKVNVVATSENPFAVAWSWEAV